MKRYFLFSGVVDTHGKYLGTISSENTPTFPDRTAVPIEDGVRIAILRPGVGWVPARIKHVSGQSDDLILEVQAFPADAAAPNGIRLALALSSTVVSLDFLGAEEQQALLVKQAVETDGRARFYRGRLFLRRPAGEVASLERDTKIEIEFEPNQRSTWLIKDLLPKSNQIVLREPTERNGLSVSLTKHIPAESMHLASAKILQTPRFRFALETPHERHKGYRIVPFVWLKQMLSNTKGILSVIDMILLRPLSGGLLPDGHPWTTGINPETGGSIWSSNVIFSTPRKASWKGDSRHAPDSDEVILHKVGTYLATMVKKSASTLEHPFGTGGRMPAAVNYIHGTVHYNAGILLFNDFEEAIYYFSDPRFVAEIQRFAAETQREIMVIFRERIFEPQQYAYFAGMIRSVLPWFSNTNGPVRARTAENQADPFLVDGKVMWGNPAPYPVVNPITGNWIADVYAVSRAEEEPEMLQRICRPPIVPGLYFREQYQGSRQHAQRMERLLAIGTAKRVQARGDGLFFVDQAALNKERELARIAKPKYEKLPAIVNKRWPVVIVGAGPAGLALARQLQKRGIEALVLEKGSAAGESWRHLPANLSLITRWSLNELPDTPDQIRPTETVIDGHRFAKYLENYMAYHQLVVATGVQVTNLAPAEDGGISVSLAEGETIRAAEVVNTTGYLGNEFIPDIPGASETAIRQLHFGRYSSPAQVAELLDGGSKRILIVGKGLSAGQAMLELDKAGFQVELSVRGEIKFGASPRWSLFVQRFLPAVERLYSWFRGRRPARKLPMQGGKTRRLIKSGKVVVRSDIAHFNGSEVVFRDGSKREYDLILYCTGFRPQLTHLPTLTLDRETGLPRLSEMESDEMPHLHFLGLDGMRSPTSRFLRGIREDAVILAERLKQRFADHV